VTKSDKVVIGVGIVVLGFLFLAGPEKQQDAKSPDDLAWDMMSNAKAAVRAHLKDPGSAEFGRIFTHRGIDDRTVVCGWVNAKNAFGGYHGEQRFISNGTGEATFVEEDVRAADFQVSWARFCGE
jgi:hypothetical protein